MYDEKVSVIMSVYNCDKTLNESIDSILSQTYENWEFIICDDCSTDNTYEILNSYKERYPDKFILLKNERNMKLSYSLNKCLEKCTGSLIARMDGDDISKPDRFIKQVEFLRNNNEYDLVGTCMQRFDGKETGDLVTPKEYPDKYILKKRVPFSHSTIMTYKYVYDKLNGYTVSKRTNRSQDYDLWFRFMAENFKGYNIQEPLYMVRENLQAIKRRTFMNRYYIMKTAFWGYKILNYPIHWYIYPLLEFLKAFVPAKLVLLYRKYQTRRYINNRIESKVK